MRLDPRQVTGAAEALTSAADQARAVLDLEVPRLFGKRAAIARIDQGFVGLGSLARDAASRIEPLGAPFADALEGARGLEHAAMGHAPGSGALTAAERGEVEQAMWRARTAAETLTVTGAGLAVPSAELPAFLHDTALVMPGNRGAVAAAPIIAAERADELGQVAPFLAAGSGHGNAAWELGRTATAVPFEPNDAWRSLLRVASEEQVRADHLRDGFEVVARHNGLDPLERLPAWLAEADATSAVALDPLQLHDLRMRATLATREDVVVDVLEQLMEHPIRSRLNAARAARELPAELAVDMPLPTSTSELMPDEVDALRDAWIELASQTPERLQGTLDRLGRRHPSIEVIRRRARLATDQPELLIGDAASRPWARELVTSIDDGSLRGRRPELVSSTWDFLRRTGGDRARMFDEFAQLAAADGAPTSAEAEQAAAALVVLPNEARPPGAAHIDDLLDAAYGKLNLSAEDRYYRMLDGELPGSGALGRYVARRLGLMLDAERVANQAGITRQVVLDELDDLLARPADQLDASDIDRMATLLLVEGSASPGLGSPARLLRHLGDPSSTDLGRAVDEVRVWNDARRLAGSDGFSVSAAADELRELVQRPFDQLDEAALRRIQMLTSLPGDARPIDTTVARSGDGTIARLATGDDWHTTIAGARDLIERERTSLALALERGELMRSGATAETVDRELRSLLAIPDQQLSADQLRRIAALDGLPASMRAVEPNVPDAARLGATWRPNMTAQDPHRRTNLALLRLALDAVDEAARTGATRAEHTLELADLLMRPLPLQLNASEQRRVALLASMPVDVRPPIAELGGNTTSSLSSVALSGAIERADLVVRSTRAGLVAELPDALDRVVAASRRAGEPLRLADVDTMLAPILLDASDSELARHGISRLELLAEVLGPSRDSGDKQIVQWATYKAQMVLAGLDESALDPASRTVVGQLRSLLERNAARANGSLSDGYAWHPDYAEHGRAVAAADLLAALARRVPEEPVESSSAAGGELLSW
ncbi:MAG: hypothetical protein KDC46_11910 [Thermoleophilia bacterium]|nr:hypothetical protein [Thermoleophilia bacterium]